MLCLSVKSVTARRKPTIFNINNKVFKILNIINIYYNTYIVHKYTRKTHEIIKKGFIH